MQRIVLSAHALTCDVRLDFAQRQRNVGGRKALDGDLGQAHMQAQPSEMPRQHNAIKRGWIQDSKPPHPALPKAVLVAKFAHALGVAC